MSTYAIGDIQGCFDEFQLLLKKMAFDPGSDKLWLAGDLINRGPDNQAVMDYVMSLGDSATCVLGNHDLHFIAVANDLKTVSRSDTLDDLLSSTNCQDYVNWLRKQPLIHLDPDLGYAMVHAGIPPHWSLDEAKSRAVEVESCLTAEFYRDFLAVMYGNEPSSWSHSLTGYDRLRIITNYFTRLRFCKADGQLELTHKTTAAPAGFAPWFTFDRGNMDQKIVFGHWAALEGNTDRKDIIALDTGCVWGLSLIHI